MTRLHERPRDKLEDRRDELLRDNREHLNRGEWSKYAKNCERIRRITVELNHRENMKRRQEWEDMV